MAKVPILSFNTDPGSLGASPNRYFSTAIGPSSTNTTEALRKVNWRVAGVFSGLYILVTANTRDADVTLKLRVNGATVNNTLTIPNSTSGAFSDVTNSDTIAADDDVNYMYTPAGSSGAVSYTAMGINFAATSNTFVMNCGRWQWQGTDPYNGINNLDDANATEANTQSQIKTAGTIKGMFWNVEDNGRGGTAGTMVFRKNGANGNQTLSITASTTGMFVDASNTDTVAVDDKITTSISGGSAGQTAGRGGWGFETTTSVAEFGSTYQAGGTTPTSATRYYPIGFFDDSVTTETNTKTDARIAGTYSKLRIYLSTNTISATSTFRFRKNGADGNQAVSITASTTGWFVDASNTDSVVETDDINLSLVTGASGTSLRVTSEMITFTVVTTAIKTMQGLAIASVKTAQDLAIASVKNKNGLA